MREPILRHSFVQINGSSVHLAQYGPKETLIKSQFESSSSPPLTTTLTSNSVASSSYGSLHDSLENGQRRRSDTKPKKVVVFVPGNPGTLGIYHDFLTSVYRVISSPSEKIQSATILAIGHNNFDHPDHVNYKAEERIRIDDDELNFVEKAVAKNYLDEPHNVELQVLNKLVILKRLLKVDLEDCKLVFIGHSIGCYIILKLLQDRMLASVHEGSVLIHPALENLALTPKGSTFYRLFSYKFDLVAQAIAYVLDNYLPTSAKVSFTRWLCSPQFIEGSSEMAVESMMQLTSHKTLDALIKMAKSELVQVKDLNARALIEPQISRLKLIYAINDHWVNTDNRRLLRELYPDLYMEEQPTLHAFVMDPQTVVDYSLKVGMFVQEFIDKIDE